MPNIPTYEARTQGIDTRPLNQASSAYGALARTRAYAGEEIGRSIGSGIAAVGAGAQDLADAREREKAMMEITQAAPVLGKTQMDLNNDYNKVMNSVDANAAPEAAREWYDNVFESRAQELIDGAQTKQGKEYMFSRVQSWREHMQAKIAGDLATKRGAAVQQNLTNAVLYAGNMVHNDWTTRDLALGNLQSAWDSMKSDPNLSPEQIAKGDEYVAESRRKILENGIEGLIMNNPTAALEQLHTGEGPFGEISADKRMELIGAAEAWEGRQRTDENYQRVEAERKVKQVSDNRVGDYINSFYTDGKLTIPPNLDEQIARDPTLTNDDKGKIYTFINKIQEFRKDVGDGGDTFNRMYAASLSGKPPPRGEVIDAFSRGELNKTEVDALLKTPDGDKESTSAKAVVKETYTWAEAALNPKGFGGGSLDRSGKGAAKVRDFSIWMNSFIESGRQQGMTPDQLLSDPKQMAKVKQEVEFLKRRKEETGAPYGMQPRSSVTPNDIPSLPANPPGLVERGNIDLDKRQVLRLPGGVYKTEESITIGTDRGQVIIPTVIDGKKVSKQEAIDHFKKTGEHLGIFDTDEHAEPYAQAVHLRQQAFYRDQSAPKKSLDDIFNGK